MTYLVDGTEYDEDEVEEMTMAELQDIKKIAEKQARDADILINRGKSEWEKHGRDPAYGLPPERYQELKTRRAEALGLIEAIKLEMGE